MKATVAIVVALIACFTLETTMNAETPAPAPKPAPEAKDATSEETFKTATFGAGCFWCVEAVFERLDGVKDVRSGYEGGHTKNPTYKQICRGDTGHAEVIEMKYNPEKIPFTKLVDMFFDMHDPTTLNRQGNDVGTQYRSVIFYHDDEQKKVAEEAKKKLDASGKHKNPVVTQIVPAEKFYVAEKYHQDFFQLNPDHGYNRNIIAPKLKKLDLLNKPVVDK